jgi:hypothetical protein
MVMISQIIADLYQDEPTFYAPPQPVARKGIMQRIRAQHARRVDDVVRKDWPSGMRFHQPPPPTEPAKPERGLDTGHAVAVEVNEQAIGDVPLTLDVLHVVADEIAQMLEAERKTYTRELTAALREMQIELAKTQSEVAELRGALAAVRTGKVLDLPAMAHERGVLN